MALHCVVLALLLGSLLLKTATADVLAELQRYHRIPSTRIQSPLLLQEFVTKDAGGTPPPIMISVVVEDFAVPSSSSSASSSADSSSLPSPLDHSSLQLCISLVNRRFSWYQQLSCSSSFGDFARLELVPDDLPPGVYSLRSYLVPSSALTLEFPPGSPHPPITVDPSVLNHRGGHDVAFGESESAFVVDSADYLSLHVARSALHGKTASELLSDLQSSGRIDVPPESAPPLVAKYGLRRLGALSLVSGILSSPSFAAVLSAAVSSPSGSAFPPSSSRDSVVVLLCNRPHHDLTLNAVFSANAAGVRNVIVFTVGGLFVGPTQQPPDPPLCSPDGRFAYPLSSELTSTRCFDISPLLLASSGLCSPDVSSSSSCSSLFSENRDVWSKGFADLAILKPAVLLAVNEMGVDALWCDTDIVFTGGTASGLTGALGVLDVLQGKHNNNNNNSSSINDVRVKGKRQLWSYPSFLAGDVSKAPDSASPPDISIQSGGIFPLRRGAPLGAHFPPARASLEELCTGFYYLRSSAATRLFVRHVILELATREEDVRFGDQSAFNVVLFEWGKRRAAGGRESPDEMVDLKVVVLNPVHFPTGAVFFDFHDSVYDAAKRNPDESNLPFIVHNNFLIGNEKKVRRFQEHGMWFRDRFAGSGYFERVLGSPPTPSSSSSSSSSALETSQLVLGLPLFVSPTPLSPSVASSRPSFSSSDYFAPFSPPPSVPSAATLYLSPPSSCGAASSGAAASCRNLIVTFSTVVDRPWFEDLTFPRLSSYAALSGADLLVLRFGGSSAVSTSSTPLPCPTFGADGEGNSHAYNDCLKALKPRLWIDALNLRDPRDDGKELYDQVLYLDDTVLAKVEGLHPASSVFASLSSSSSSSSSSSGGSTPPPLGAVGEGGRVKPLSDLQARMRLLCLRYHCATGDGGGNDDGLLYLDEQYNARLAEHWYVNSGVVLFSNAWQGRQRKGLERHLHSYVNLAGPIKRDQGFLNYVIFKEGWEVADLGIKFNYFGSLINADGSSGQVENCTVQDAHFVHITSGVYSMLGKSWETGPRTDDGLYRHRVMMEVDRLWKETEGAAVPALVQLNNNN